MLGRQVGTGLCRQRQKPAAVGLLQARRVSMGSELAAGLGQHQGVHVKTAAGAHRQHRFVHQRGECAQFDPCHLLGSVTREPAMEDGQGGLGVSLRGAEQAPGAIKNRVQVDITALVQQIDAALELVGNFSRRQQAHPARSQFQGQGQTVQTAADLRHRAQCNRQIESRVDGPRARGKQDHGQRALHGLIGGAALRHRQA